MYYISCQLALNHVFFFNIIHFKVIILFMRSKISGNVRKFQNQIFLIEICVFEICKYVGR